MRKVVYIFILAVVTFCRLVSVALPFVQNSHNILMAWHDQECNNEDGELEKAKHELKEDSWLAQIVVTDFRSAAPTFIICSDNNLLEHTRKPITPPPDVASYPRYLSQHL